VQKSRQNVACGEEGEAKAKQVTGVSNIRSEGVKEEE
jgi:hypothetical protein